MDLNSFATADKATVYLRHPVSGEQLTHEDEPMWIELYGVDSSQFNKQMHQVRKDLLLLSKGQKPEDIDDFEYTETHTTEVLVKVTVDWRIFWNGEFVEFSPEKATELYTNFRWIRDQIDRFVHDRRNFMKAS